MYLIFMGYFDYYNMGWYVGFVFMECDKHFIDKPWLIDSDYASLL